jgi:hypothetical protein
MHGYGIHSPTEPLNTSPIETQDVEYICSVSKVNFTDKSQWFYKREANASPIPIENLEGMVDI